MGVCVKENHGLCIDSVDERVGKLAKLLQLAEMAHAAYEEQPRIIATDDGAEAMIDRPEWMKWPEFYAKFMLDNGLDAVLEHRPTDVEHCDYLCGDSLALDG
jgi:hypothetical protein